MGRTGNDVIVSREAWKAWSTSPFPSLIPVLQERQNLRNQTVSRKEISTWWFERLLPIQIVECPEINKFMITPSALWREVWGTAGNTFTQLGL